MSCHRERDLGSASSQGPILAATMTKDEAVAKLGQRWSREIERERSRMGRIRVRRVESITQSPAEALGKGHMKGHIHF